MYVLKCLQSENTGHINITSPPSKCSYTPPHPTPRTDLEHEGPQYEYEEEIEEREHGEDAVCSVARLMQVVDRRLAAPSIIPLSAGCTCVSRCVCSLCVDGV